MADAVGHPSSCISAIAYAGAFFRSFASLRAAETHFLIEIRALCDMLAIHWGLPVAGHQIGNPCGTAWRGQLGMEEPED
jgi:hypothetical protein